VSNQELEELLRNVINPMGATLGRIERDLALVLAWQKRRDKRRE
jgi:hypothetical protein